MKNKNITRRGIIQRAVPAFIAGSAMAACPNAIAAFSSEKKVFNTNLNAFVSEEIWLNSKEIFQEVSGFINSATGGAVQVYFIPKKSNENSIVECLQHGICDFAIEQRSKWFLDDASQISLHMQSLINHKYFQHWFNGNRKELVDNIFYQHSISPVSYGYHSLERPMGIMPQEPVADITDEKVIDLLTDQVLFGCRGFYKNDELDIKDIRIDYGFLENVNYPKIALPEINKKFSQLALTKDQIVKEYYFHNVLGAPLYEPVDAFSSLPVMRKISQAHQAIISLAMQKLTKIINHDLAEVSLSVLHKNLDPARNKVIKTAIVAVVKGEIGEQIKYLSENDKTIRKLILS